MSGWLLPAPRRPSPLALRTAHLHALQDAALKKAVDDRRAERALRAEFAAEQAAAERARQWRVARGTATAEDLAGPSQEQFGEPAREAWMTELPPERSARGAMPSLVGGSAGAEVVSLSQPGHAALFSCSFEGRTQSAVWCQHNNS